MKDHYAKALTELGDSNPMVVTVEADCANTIGTAAFGKKYPDRQINVGIAEANAVSVSAGLSVTGFIPFFHTFAAFASRRVFDQAFISVAYAGLNVKIVGADPGVTAAHNGGTHMPFEDAGIMRNIPGAVVIEPTDAAMLRVILPQIANHYGLVYMRTSRKNSPMIYEEDQTFTIGKGVLLQDGTDVTPDRQRHHRRRSPQGRRHPRRRRHQRPRHRHVHTQADRQGPDRRIRRQDRLRRHSRKPQHH